MENTIQLTTGLNASEKTGQFIFSLHSNGAKIKEQARDNSRHEAR